VLLADSPALLEEWEKLVVKYECKGKPTHDARIVAAMNIHDVKQLLTFNAKDFARYGEITVLDPIVTSGRAATL
jgi:predicted nucleic acid-binding protein